MQGEGSPRPADLLPPRRRIAPGLASPHIRHGRYSKDLPTHLAAVFDAALADPSILQLTPELALVDTLASQVVARMDQAGAGSSSSEATAELLELLERRRRLVETETRRIALAEDTLTAGEALLFVAAITAAIKEHVHDAKTLAAIGREFAQILGDEGAGRALSTAV